MLSAATWLMKALCFDSSKVPVLACHRWADQATLDQPTPAAPTRFRLRHQENKAIPPSPEANSGRAAGSGACDGGSVTCAVNIWLIVPPELGPSVKPFTATCHKLPASVKENVVGRIIRVSE